MCYNPTEKEFAILVLYLFESLFLKSNLHIPFCATITSFNDPLTSYLKLPGYGFWDIRVFQNTGAKAFVSAVNESVMTSTRKALIPLVTVYQKIHVLRIPRKRVDAGTLLPGDAGALFELV